MAVSAATEAKLREAMARLGCWPASPCTRMVP